MRLRRRGPHVGRGLAGGQEREHDRATDQRGEERLSGRGARGGGRREEALACLLAGPRWWPWTLAWGFIHLRKRA